MKKTDILDVAARKLAPFMFLFGLYLISFGDTSPGGGFQGGVVVASGVILLTLARSTDATEQLLPRSRLSVAEAIGFVAFLIAGSAGIVVGGGFLSDLFFSTSLSSRGTAFIFLLNAIIGMKVATGVSLICLTLFHEVHT